MDLTRMAIFAARPAPIQINFLGSPSTTGANFIDYFIGDYFSTPPHRKDVEQNTEKLILMPHTYQVCEHKSEYTEFLNMSTFGVPSDKFSEDLSEEEREQLELLSDPKTFSGIPFQDDSKPFIFCNFNQASKINREVWEIWMEILERVPNSVLWMIANPECTRETFEKTANKSKMSGRIFLTTSVNKRAHIQRMRICDLLLDTFYYNAHASAGDALWAGVPILTLEGKTISSRVCGSMCIANGFPEFVVKDRKEYLERAVYLGNEKGTVRMWKERLIQVRNSSHLYDVENYVKNLSNALLQIWRHYLKSGREGLPAIVHADPSRQTSLPKQEDVIS